MTFDLTFLRDPVWQAVGVLLAVLLGVVSFVQARSQRNRKSLMFGVLSDQLALLCHLRSGAFRRKLSSIESSRRLWMT